MVSKSCVLFIVIVVCTIYEAHCASLPRWEWGDDAFVQVATNCINQIESPETDSYEMEYFFKNGEFPSEKALNHYRCVFDCMFKSIGFDVGAIFQVVRKGSWTTYGSDFDNPDSNLRQCMRTPPIDSSDKCEQALRFASCTIKMNGNIPITSSDTTIKSYISVVCTIYEAHCSKWSDAALIGLKITGCFTETSESLTTAKSNIKYFYKNGDFPSEKATTDFRCFFHCLFKSIDLVVDASYEVVENSKWERAY
ncbi:hypothetical protein ACFE04_008325 [Oxalis oulophora]